MTRLRRLRQDDSGVTLVLVLVFMLIVSAFITVALDKNMSTANVGQQVRTRTQLQYALDGGVDRTLQRLQKELSDGSPTSCTAPLPPNGSGTVSTGTFSLNNQAATWKCTTLAGRAATTGDVANTNFALVVTSANDGALTSQSGVSQDLQVAGSVYLNGKVTNSNLGKPVEITDGDLVSPASTNCAGNLAGLTNVSLVGTGQLRSCTEQTLTESLPTVSLPSPAPTIDLAATPLINGVSIGGCKVYYPGRYNAPPVIGNNSKNYFVSGLYYFAFPTSASLWQIDDANVEVTAGQRSLGTDTAVPSNACSGMTDSTAMGDAAVAALTTTITPYRYTYGATWVFGGTSRLDVKKGAITMFSPPAGGSSVPVNIVGGSAYTANDYSPQPVGTTMLTGGGNNSSLEVNAKLFAPNSYIEVFSTNDTIAAVRGGVVGYQVQLKASASGSDALVISASGSQGNPPPPFRTVLVETSDGSGTSSAVNRAVATISNFSPFTVRVQSWRTG